MRPYSELTKSLTYICRGIADAVSHITVLWASGIWPSAGAAVPGSIHTDVLKVRVNGIGMTIVEFLTGCWPAPLGDIMARGIARLGPAAL